MGAGPHKVQIVITRMPVLGAEVAQLGQVVAQPVGSAFHQVAADSDTRRAGRRWLQSYLPPPADHLPAPRRERVSP